MNANVNQGFIPPPQPSPVPYNPAPTPTMNVVPQPQPQYQPAPQPQPQPQLQPAPQPQPTQYPAFPSVAPGQNPQGYAPPLVQPQYAPVAQPQPPANPYADIYQEVARELNIPVEQASAVFADDPRRFAQIVKQAVNNRQQDRQPAPQPAAPPGNQPVEIPQVAFQYMKPNAEGFWEPTVNNPQVATWAQAQNEKIFQERVRAQQFSADPTSIFKDPAVSKMISEVVDQRVRQESQLRELESVRTTYREKFAPAIIAKNPQTGHDMQDLNGNPLLNTLGEAFNRHAKALHGQGLRESAQLYEYAMMMAERETGMSSQPQQAQQAQAFQPLNGNYAPMQRNANVTASRDWNPNTQQYQGFNGQINLPMQPQPPQNGYPAMQPVYAQARVNGLRPNTQGMMAQPGMAPPRLPQPINSRMTFRDQITMATQGMADNQGMEFYWNNLFGK